MCSSYRSHAHARQPSRWCLEHVHQRGGGWGEDADNGVGLVSNQHTLAYPFRNIPPVLVVVIGCIVRDFWIRVGEGEAWTLSSTTRTRIEYIVSPGGRDTHFTRTRRESGPSNHQGGWQIVDAERNWLIAGERFDLSLDDVEQWLTEDQEARASRARTA